MIFRVGMRCLAVPVWKVLLGTVFLAAVIGVIEIIPKEKRAVKTDVPFYSAGVGTRSLYDAAYDAVPTRIPMDMVSIVVPHHLIAARGAADVFTRTGSHDISTVVIVSPNHFHRGQARIALSLGTWETPYGKMESDAIAIQNVLESAPVAEIDEVSFSGEHGIGAVTPFIRRSFPNARIIAVSMDDSASEEASIHFGKTIAKVLPEALLIASVDMSHYLPDYIADAHDEVTLAVLRTGDPSFAGAEVDSVPVLRALLGFNEVRNSRSFRLAYHGSSSRDGALRNPWDNTSHIAGWFDAGPSVHDSIPIAPVARWLSPGVRNLPQIEEDGVEFCGYGSLAHARIEMGTTRLTNDEAMQFGVSLAEVDYPTREHGALSLPSRAWHEGREYRMEYQVLVHNAQTRVYALPMDVVAGCAIPTSSTTAHAITEKLGIKDDVLLH
jgi:AmmeMemoRadiSam system protein B